MKIKNKWNHHPYLQQLWSLPNQISSDNSTDNLFCTKKKQPDSYRISIPSQDLTWNLKMAPWNRRFLLETIIFRFYVNLPGCTPGAPDSAFSSGGCCIAAKSCIAAWPWRSWRLSLVSLAVKGGSRKHGHWRMQTWIFNVCIYSTHYIYHGIRCIYQTIYMFLYV